MGLPSLLCRHEEIHERSRVRQRRDRAVSRKRGQSGGWRQGWRGGHGSWAGGGQSHETIQKGIEGQAKREPEGTPPEKSRVIKKSSRRRRASLLPLPLVQLVPYPEVDMSISTSSLSVNWLNLPHFLEPRRHLASLHHSRGSPPRPAGQSRNLLPGMTLIACPRLALAVCLVSAPTDPSGAPWPLGLEFSICKKEMTSSFL